MFSSEARYAPRSWDQLFGVDRSQAGSFFEAKTS
jgi:hypothetical protein